MILLFDHRFLYSASGAGDLADSKVTAGVNVRKTASNSFYWFLGTA